MKILIALSLLLSLWFANAANVRLPDLSGVTDKGLKIEIYSELSPLSINQIHSWHLRVLDRNNEILELEELNIFGGMHWQLQVELQLNGVEDTAIIDFDFQ